MYARARVSQPVDVGVVQDDEHGGAERRLLHQRLSDGAAYADDVLDPEAEAGDRADDGDGVANARTAPQLPHRRILLPRHEVRLQARPASDDGGDGGLRARVRDVPLLDLQLPPLVVERPAHVVDRHEEIENAHPARAFLHHAARLLAPHALALELGALLASEPVAGELRRGAEEAVADQVPQVPPVGTGRAGGVAARVLRHRVPRLRAVHGVPRLADEREPTEAVRLPHDRDDGEAERAGREAELPARRHPESVLLVLGVLLLRIGLRHRVCLWFNQ
mmetsp:Transcript_12905/g.40063  ORF Transcript_12905/g.40063 Transcript_12905/m.40063 type:complete len:278 (+) Transcript_12905:99-932(+)